MFGSTVRKNDVDPIAPFRNRIYEMFGLPLENALVQALGRPLSRSDADALLTWRGAEDVLSSLRTEWALALDVRMMRPIMDAYAVSETQEQEDMGLLAKRLDPLAPMRSTSKSITDAAVWGQIEQQRLARLLSVEQEAAIRHMVARARESGYSAARLRMMIQNGGVVGLDERGVNAVFNMIRRELDSPLSARTVLINADAYAKRLLRARAQMIARTELSRAIHQGKIAAWRLAARYGRLRDDPYIEWVADGRPCEVCAGLDGTIVPLGSGFAGVGYPPDPHPNCMCTLRLVDRWGNGMRPGKVRLGRRRFGVGRPRVPQTIQTFF